MHTRIKMVREMQRDNKGKKYTQTKFAEEMKVTRDMVATYESGRVEPSPLFIATLCNKYNVNEIWLRTGEGDMYKPLSREEEIALIVNDLASNEEESFRYSLIKIISSLNDDQLETLKEIAIKIVKENSLI